MLARRCRGPSAGSFADAFNARPPKSVGIPRNTTRRQPANSCNLGEIPGAEARAARFQFVGRCASVRKPVLSDQISTESVERLTVKPSFDVVGIGEISVDHVCVIPRWPARGGKARMDHYALHGGGQVATAMLACARLGLRAKFLGKVGDDAGGRQALQGLSHEGVDVSGVRVVAGASTQTAVILVDAAAGERAVIWNHDPRLVLDEVAPAEITSARALHVDVTGVSGSLAGLRAARAAGMLTSIDIDHVPERVEEILALIDL